MAAYGLYSHIESNKRRSVALLVGLFGLVYLLVYAGALAGEAMSYDASLQYLASKAWQDLIAAAPYATVGTAVWIVIAFYFHQTMIDLLTGGREVSRTEEPHLYNLLENLCISRGITMPKLKVMESDALNAFATGMNEKQYAITVTTGLLAALDGAELEAVLGHELTHIRNGDVRLLVIAVIIAGAIAFFAEMFFRLWFNTGFRGRRSSDGESDRGRGGNFIAILIAVVLIAVAWLLSSVIRFALSRSREFLADRFGRAHQEPGRHDSGAAQDRRPRRTSRRYLRRNGDVRRQSARGIHRSVFDSPADRAAHQGVGRGDGRARPRPAVAAGYGRDAGQRAAGASRAKRSAGWPVGRRG